MAKRPILERDALAAELARIGEGPGDTRAALLDHLKQELGRGREEVERRFMAAANGAHAAADNCAVMDAVIAALHDYCGVKSITIVAVGGYGRGELAPFSDIDLLFLLGGKPTPRIKKHVEFMLYMLWDLGLKLGQATRSIEQCLADARSDMTIRTGLLEARWVAGDGEKFETLRRRFTQELVMETGDAFVRAKLDERNVRHRKLGDSRYVLEPNIKDGKGGLRDLHTLFWIAKYVYRVSEIADLVGRDVLAPEELRKFVKANSFLWTLRFHLHYIANRPEERLTFDVQPEMAARMRYSERAGLNAVERFMKHYFLVAKDVGDLTRIFCAAIEAEHQASPLFSIPRWAALRREVDGFAVERGRLMVRADDAFAADPIDMLRIFQVADTRGLDIHPKALRLITQNLKRINGPFRKTEEANRLFMEILTSRRDPETALKRMNEAGVLGRFIPDFGRIVAQVQHDMYHVYTVDEHTIRAVGVLAGIERGDYAETLPLATGIIHEVLSRRVLYLAVFLHDVAKGRDGDHSELGAVVAGKLGQRLGFSAEEVEQAAWLVRHHLLFSYTAFRRDLDDVKTVEDFVAEVQSQERLRLLLVLTAADIRAVGPNVWTGWKGALLRQLYNQAAEVMSCAHAAEGKAMRVADAKDALAARLKDWSPAARADHLERLYPPYWLGFDGETHARHAAALKELDQAGAPLVLDSRVNRFHGVTEITFVTRDQPALFSKLAGALALSGASIVNAKIFTTVDGTALDVFWVQDIGGGPFERPDRLARLSVLAAQVVDQELDPGEALATRRRTASRASAVFTYAPRVLIDNNVSTRHTVIEVNGRDRPGLLHDVTRALSDLGISIVTAHVSTFGERAVDVFYAKDAFGLKIEHDGKLAKIRACLLEALADPKKRPGKAATAA